MQMRAVRVGAALVLTAGFVAGCQDGAQHTPYADNPLLQSRQPLLQPSAGGESPAQLAQGTPHSLVAPPTPAANLYPSTAVAQAHPTAEPRPAYAPAVTNYTPPAPAPDAGPAMPSAAAAPTPPAPVPLPGQVASPPPEPVAAVPAPVMPAAPAPAPSFAAPAAPVPAVAAAEPAAPAPVAQASAHQANGHFGHSGDYTWLQGELDRHYRGYLTLRFQPASEEDTYGGKVRLENDPRLAEYRAGDVVAVEGELVRDPDPAEAQAWAQYPRFHVREIKLVERK
jgi:hypothetical protein